MAEIPRMELTEAGYQLYGKIQTGQATLNISRVVIGTGFLNDNETIFDLAALKNEIDVTTQILKNEIVGNGQTKLSFRITAATEDFPLREIGVTAIDPDNGEILYCACNLGNNAEYVVVYGGILPVTTEADIYFAIGVGSIKVEFARDTAAVPYKEFEEHTSDNGNPHGVTAAQVFPDNANVLKNITAENITNFEAAAKVRHTHENKSILDKITDVLVEKWNSAVSHITNRANPHGVTKSQVGLGNVTNESKKTMFNSPEFTGTPKAPTAATGVSSTQIATTAFVQNELKVLYDKIKLLGNSYLGDVIASIDVEIYSICHGGHSEYTYYRLRCIGCSLKSGGYVSNTSDKYIQYGSRNYAAGNFAIGFDPDLVIVSPINEVTLDNCLYVGGDKAGYKTIFLSDVDHWSDEREEGDGYVEYSRAEARIYNN